MHSYHKLLWIKGKNYTRAILLISILLITYVLPGIALLEMGNKLSKGPRAKLPWGTNFGLPEDCCHPALWTHLLYLLADISMGLGVGE